MWLTCRIWSWHHSGPACRRSDRRMTAGAAGSCPWPTRTGGGPSLLPAPCAENSNHTNQQFTHLTYSQCTVNAPDQVLKHLTYIKVFTYQSIFTFANIFTYMYKNLLKSVNIYFSMNFLTRLRGHIPGTIFKTSKWSDMSLNDALLWCIIMHNVCIHVLNYLTLANLNMRK